MMRKNGEAVSPVVGVMLMLVVTIIIAAVVSAFAGGMAGNTKETPVAVLEVKLYKDYYHSMTSTYGSYTPYMTIEHKSGDPLPTEDLKIVTYYQDASGTLITGGLDGGECGEPDQTVNVTGYTTYQLPPMGLSDMNRFGYTMSSSAGWFGNDSAVMRPGDVMCTMGDYTTASGYPTVEDPALSYIISGGDEWYSLIDTDTSGWNEGTPVSVKILHKPSGKYIYDAEVFIQ